MEDGVNHVLNSQYPIVMSRIQSDLAGNEVDPQLELLLLKVAIDKNRRSIFESCSKKVRKLAEGLAGSITDEELIQFGVPELPVTEINSYENCLKTNLQSYYCNEENMVEELKDAFYFGFAKRLLKRNLYWVTQILNQIRDFITRVDRNILSGSEFLWPFIGITVPRIENLLPYFTYYAQKEILELSVTKNRRIIEDKIMGLKVSNHLSLLDKTSINYAFNLIQKYELDYHSYYIFIMVCLDYEADLDHHLEPWENLSLESRLSVYIYLYLILSEDLPHILNIDTEIRLDSLHGRYHPSKREMLRIISTRYPLRSGVTQKPIKNIYEKSQFNWFKLIESVSINYQSGSHYFDKHSLDLTQALRPKLFFNIRVMPEYLEKDCKIQLEKLNDCNSSHIVICISGFLSEIDEHKENWINLTSLYPNSAFYSLKWKASHSNKLIQKLLKRVSPNRQFNDCFKSAQYTGACLAELLMTREEMKKSCVSLIGFSLGTMVMFQCLDSLSCCYPDKIIHDAIFIGSAVPSSYMSKIREIKQNAVAGRLINIISDHDFVLKELFTIVSKESAFGVTAVDGMETYNVSDTVNGHREYRKNFKKVFKKLSNY